MWPGCRSVQLAEFLEGLSALRTSLLAFHSEVFGCPRVEWVIEAIVAIAKVSGCDFLNGSKRSIPVRRPQQAECLPGAQVPEMNFQNVRRNIFLNRDELNQRGGLPQQVPEALTVLAFGKQA